MDKFKESVEGNTEKEKIDIPMFFNLTYPETKKAEKIQKQIFEANDISYLRKEVLESADFDTTFKWPEKLPEGFDPEKLVEECKNPGLGIRKLHEEGITGKGVTVAIIDQKISPSHIEFKDNLIANKEYDKLQSEVSIHGPAVVSLLAGKNCGAAPDAKIYYAEGTIKDYTGYIKALEDIIKYNKHNDQKIKIVSVSSGHNDYPKLQEWIEIKEKAKNLGIIVIDSNYFIENTITGGGSKTNKDQFDDYEFPLFYKDSDMQKLSVEKVKNRLSLVDEETKKNFFNKYKSIEEFINIRKEELLNELIIPSDYRTMASRKGDNEYAYNAKGGWSWAIPYFAGVFVLALQVNPDLTNEKFLEIARSTAGKTKKGLKVINPKGIIEEVKKMVPENK